MNEECAQCGKALPENASDKLCPECGGQVAANLLGSEDESTIIEVVQSDRMIAHYRQGELLGEGGMGQVFRATDTKLGRDVAIKILPETLSGSSQVLARFEREAKVLAALNHPNIASIFGIEDCDGSKAIVMELVEGETLGDRLKKGPLSSEEALRVFQQIAAAVEAAHDKGIIHRDLKPGNIKFTGEGRVKVLDFGLAKAMETGTTPDGQSQASTLSTEMTRPGTVMGTPSYMSPEQTRGEVVDKRTDVWAFGCCLYESLTGRKPFHARTISDIMAEVLKADPDFTMVPPETPHDVVSLLRRCLEKEPRRRLRDLGDIAIRLEETVEAVRRQADVDDSASLPVTASGKGWFRSAVALVAGIIVGAASFAVWGPDRGTVGEQAVNEKSLRSVAILPFDDLKPEEEYGWLSDAMADAIRDKLVKLDGLVVRRAHLPFRQLMEGGASVSEAARSLDVDAFVQGSFVHHQGELRLRVSLYNGVADRDIPLGAFSNGAEQVFELQDEVALAIAEKVRSNLGEGERTALAQSQGVDPEAYQLYQRARRAYFSYSANGFEQAATLLQAAIAIDPAYGEAVALLANIPWVTTIWGGSQMTPMEGVARSQSILEQYGPQVRNPVALKRSQSWLALLDGKDFSGAEKLFREYRVTQQERDGGNHARYLSLVEGRFLESLPMLEAELELEPGRSDLLVSLATCRFQALQYEGCIAAADQVLATNPQHWDILSRKALSLVELGQSSEAVEVSHLAVETAERHPAALCMRAGVLARAGQVEAAQEDYQAVVAMVDDGIYVNQALVAFAQAAVGDIDGALTRLEEAAGQRGEFTPWMMRQPSFHHFFSDHPRYWALIDKLKLPALPVYHPYYVIEQRMRYGERNDVRAPAIRSLAILPFDDLKPDEEFGWLSDAMADAIRQKLTAVKGIIVKREHTVLKNFIAQGLSVGEVARRLDVDAIVQGNFVHHQGSLRMNVSLYQGYDELDLPLGQFSRTADQVFELQNEVALAIADRVRSNLNEEERAAIARLQGIDPAAYEACRKGLSAYFTFSDPGYDTATTHFQRAIALDPSYGEPVARLGNIPWLRTAFGLSKQTPIEALADCRAVLDRHGPDVGDPDSLARLKGWVAIFCEWDWVRGEAFLRQVRELGNGIDDGSYARYLYLIEGRYLESLSQVGEEQALDPNRFDLFMVQVDSLLSIGHYDEALRAANATIEAHPENPWPETWKSWALAGLGRGPEAVRVADEALARAPEAPAVVVYHLVSLALAGESERVDAIISRLDEMGATLFIENGFVGLAEAALGRVDRAIERFERVAKVGAGFGAFYVRRSLALEALGKDPRYWRIVDRIQLPALPVYHPYHELEQRMRFGRE